MDYLYHIYIILLFYLFHYVCEAGQTVSFVKHLAMNVKIAW